MSEAVAYLREHHPQAADLALWLRAIVLESDADLYERVYHGWEAVGFPHRLAGYVQEAIGLRSSSERMPRRSSQ
jgi:hypothetical protein